MYHHNSIKTTRCERNLSVSRPPRHRPPSRKWPPMCWSECGANFPAFQTCACALESKTKGLHTMRLQLHSTPKQQTLQNLYYTTHRHTRHSTHKHIRRHTLLYSNYTATATSARAAARLHTYITRASRGTPLHTATKAPSTKPAPPPFPSTLYSLAPFAFALVHRHASQQYRRREQPIQMSHKCASDRRTRSARRRRDDVTSQLGGAGARTQTFETYLHIKVTFHRAISATDSASQRASATASLRTRALQCKRNGCCI